MEMKQPAQALQAYEDSSKREPNRLRTLAGAARAAELSGDMAKAKGYYAELVKLTAKSNGERPELARAKEFLARN
jgi:uncharacterized protein HemY